MNTKFGQIEIISPDDLFLKEIQGVLPYGFYPLNQEINGYKYGFVVKCESDEMKCIKQQPVEYSEDVAHKLLLIHHILILHTYLKIKDQIGDSIYYATPYLKDKGHNRFESGIAHFIFPNNIKAADGNKAFDSFLGIGATTLFQKFASTFMEIMKQEGLSLSYIGIDIRTRAQLGALFSGFMLYKGNIIFHGAKVEEGDPRFDLLRKEGIKQIIHMPSTTMEISNEQLSNSKGE